MDFMIFKRSLSIFLMCEIEKGTSWNEYSILGQIPMFGILILCCSEDGEGRSVALCFLNLSIVVVFWMAH